MPRARTRLPGTSQSSRGMSDLRYVSLLAELALLVSRDLCPQLLKAASPELPELLVDVEEKLSLCLSSLYPLAQAVRADHSLLTAEVRANTRCALPRVCVC